MYDCVYAYTCLIMLNKVFFVTFILSARFILALSQCHNVTTAFLSYFKLEAYTPLAASSGGPDTKLSISLYRSCINFSGFLFIYEI